MTRKRSIIVFSVFMAFAFMFLFSTKVNAAEKKEYYSLESYLIADDAVYYESSYGFGSGRKGIINENNQYVTIPCYAIVNGFSFLDKDGNIISSGYEEISNIIIPEAPEGTVAVFYHFRTISYRNGWVDSKYVTKISSEKPVPEKSVPEEPEEKPEVPKEPDKQDSQELAEMIQDYDDDGTTVVIVDRSSSMDKFAEEATREFRSLEVVDTTKVYVFGRYFKEISPKDITANNSEVRQNEQRRDYLDAVVNDAGKYDPEHIIIISDLGVYDGDFVKQKNLKTIDILLPFEPSRANEEIKHIKKEFSDSEVSITVREFDSNN